VLSINSLLARILERDKAENFGPSARFVVCGFGFASPVRAWLSDMVSVGTINSELLISTFGSATSAFFSR